MMRWLKSLVVVLGIFIAAGVMLLVYGFVQKARDPDWTLVDILTGKPAPAPKPTPNAAPAPAASAETAGRYKAMPLEPFGTVDLGLAVGCIVVDVAPARRRAFLIIGPPGPCHQVIVVDVAQGRVLGTIKLRP